MKPVLQTKRGLGGNCLAACLASIFEVPLESMPDLAPPECFEDWTVQSRLKKDWLAQQGLDYVEIDLEKQHYHWTSGAIPVGPCLFAVKSPTPEMREKGYGHFVVGRVREDGEGVWLDVLHDPLGVVVEKYEITAVGLFVPLRPERTALQANHDELQRLYDEVKEACARVGMERYCTHEQLMAFLESRLNAGTQVIAANESMSAVRRAERAEARAAELEAELARAETNYRTVCEERLALTTEINHDLLPRIERFEKQNAKLRAIWQLNQQYVELLKKELSDVMPFMAAHGWSSKRVDEGNAARHAINQAVGALGENGEDKR